MTASHSSDADGTLTGATRTAVLAAMRRENKALTVQQIADELGLHPNTVRFHLARLIKAHLVSEQKADSSGPGRPRMVYTASPRAADGGSETGYQFLAGILAGHLATTSPSPTAAAIAAGEEWGRYLAPKPAPFTKTTEEEAIEQVTTILNQLDFAPERSDDGHRLLLHHCPFRTVADRRPNVVCSVHLGIMRGALEAMDTPVRVTDLERFDAPHPCIAHLASAGAPSTPASEESQDNTEELPRPPRDPAERRYTEPDETG